jgi:hypothetical protein
VVTLIVLHARWGGWRLILALGVALYGVMSVMADMEAAWFAPAMTTMRLTPELLWAMLLHTLPAVLVLVVLAAVVFGKGRQPATVEAGLFSSHSFEGWVWRLALIAGAYLVLYFGFGSLVAWQNPAVRALYADGQNQEVFAPARLVPFQIMRSWLWLGFALPVLLLLRGPRWYAAVLVGLLFALPMNIVHVLPSALMEPSVRLSHFIETATSNFLFGLLVAGLVLWRNVRWTSVGSRSMPRAGMKPAGRGRISMPGIAGRSCAVSRTTILIGAVERTATVRSTPCGWTPV